MTAVTVVGVSGAAGRMGRMIAQAIADAPEFELGPLYDPEHPGDHVAGGVVTDDPAVMAAAGVVIEMTLPAVVDANLDRWRESGCHVVVGTSGFDERRIEALRERWGEGPPNCLVVPNFSIGAVLMMRFAELAAPHFAAGEIIELHHDGKADAPSGTAVATAGRMAGDWSRAVESTEQVAGALGAEVGGTRIHSVRLPGLLAHQEVLLGNPGEVLSIRHDSTDRVSFMPGVLAAVRAVPGMAGVSVGLDAVLGL